MLLQPFILRQIVGFAVSAIVNIIEDAAGNIDPVTAKAQLAERIRNAVPKSLWIEAQVENKLIAYSNWTVDKLIGASRNSETLVRNVLTRLADRDYQGAVLAVRAWLLGVVGVTASSENAPEVMGDAFADTVVGAFERETGNKLSAANDAPAVEPQMGGEGEGSQQPQQQPSSDSQESVPQQTPPEATQPQQQQSAVGNPANVNVGVQK